MTNVNISNGGNKSAALVSKNYEGGKIENVIAEGTAKFNSSYSSGICSINKKGGTISNCINKIQVTGVTYVGGICSNNSGTITQCGNEAEIESTSCYVGGITGYNGNGGTITKCYNKKNVTSKSYGCGGIAGNNNSSSNINYCYNLADIKATGKTSASYTNVGGISAYNSYSSSISYCYSSGVITSATNNGYGLIIGQQYEGSPKLLYSYATPYNSRPIIGYKKNGTSTGNATYSTSAIIGWNQDTITKNLTDNFRKDETNKNKGFPILEWEVE